MNLKISATIVLSIVIGIPTLVNAYNVDDVRRLISTNKCPRCDLTGADLRGADLRGADLREADLRGVDFTGADLRGADLTDAILTGAIAPNGGYFQ
ncbi:MAG: pentapeptide repeat-containing protein [Nostoc sp.]|uniref:pentapeptide repeat-containing protein n=1 Tax=Nostoc sp. TaxID=1180 RepID=UPI002FF805D5